MRRHPLFACALTLLLSACFPPGQNEPAAAGAGAGGAPVCDDRDACSVCASCALNGPCSFVFNTCQQDPSCVGIDECIGLCGSDLTCKQQCYDANPAGVNNYEAVTICLYCHECPHDCPDVRVCPAE